MSRLKSFIQDKTGAAAVEFALIGVVLMILLLSIIDISRAISRQMDLNSAVRSGAELSMRGRAASDVEDAIEATFSRTVGDELDSVNATTFCMCPGQDVNVDGVTGVSCTAYEPCGLGEVTWVFHDITATYTHESIFLRRIMDYSMSYGMRVQSP